MRSERRPKRVESDRASGEKRIDMEAAEDARRM